MKGGGPKVVGYSRSKHPAVWDGQGGGGGSILAPGHLGLQWRLRERAYHNSLAGRRLMCKAANQLIFRFVQLEQWGRSLYGVDPDVVNDAGQTRGIMVRLGEWEFKNRKDVEGHRDFLDAGEVLEVDLDDGTNYDTAGNGPLPQNANIGRRFVPHYQYPQPVQQQAQPPVQG